MKWRDLKTNRDRLGQLKGQTPYEILRVDPSATLAELRRAYKSLVRTYHPDSSHAFMKGTNEEIIKVINVAYQTILKERNG